MSVASLDCAWLNQVKAQVLAAGAVGRSHASHARAWFRIGDVCLELVSDYQDLLEEFETRYRDCGLAERSQDLINIRCTAGYLPGTSLLWLSFDGSNLPDPMEAALTPFRMLRHLRRYVEQRGPLPGWRMLVNTEASNRTLAAGDSRTLVINLDESPPEFVTDCIVSLVQSAQQGVLFLHAASFGIGGAGALLIGRSGAGKSTTSVALAARGHSFLGDDLAAVRLATREVLPFPKSARLRDGSFVRSLDCRVRACRHTTVTDPKGIARTLISMGDLFPASVGGPLPLRFAFLLDGFGERVAIKAFRPQIGDVKRLKSVVSETIPSWGISPGRDLMKFLTVEKLLSELQCYLLELGSPDESVAAIENVMEETCN